MLGRFDAHRHGKGYALEHAFGWSARTGWSEAVVIVDADSIVSPNLLEALAVRIEDGATALQCDYGVSNAASAWRTRLMSIALGAFHRVRSRGRERLGLSAGIRGNGWCVTQRQLRAAPFAAYSLAEDVEYGIELGLAGCRVRYVDEAHVYGAMEARGDSARSQRQRWERGRRQLLTAALPKLLRAARARGRRFCLDLAIDLLVPPLAALASATLALLVLALASRHWLAVAPTCALVGAASIVVLGAYVLRGWALSDVGASGALDLARAPWYIAWKTWTILRSRGTSAWVRTRRPGG